jgi:hypothetical protein
VGPLGLVKYARKEGLLRQPLFFPFFTISEAVVAVPLWVEPVQKPVLTEFRIFKNDSRRNDGIPGDQAKSRTEAFREVFLLLRLGADRRF